MIDDDHGLGQPSSRTCLGGRTQWPRAGPVSAISTGASTLRVAGHRDDGCAVERRECLCGDAVRGNTALAQPVVTTTDRFDGDPGRSERRCRPLPVAAGRPVMQAAQPLRG